MTLLENTTDRWRPKILMQISLITVLFCSCVIGLRWLFLFGDFEQATKFSGQEFEENPKNIESVDTLKQVRIPSNTK